MHYLLPCNVGTIRWWLALNSRMHRKTVLFTVPHEMAQASSFFCHTSVRHSVWSLLLWTWTQNSPKKNAKKNAKRKWLSLIFVVLKRRRKASFCAIWMLYVLAKCTKAKRWERRKSWPCLCVLPPAIYLMMRKHYELYNLYKLTAATTPSRGSWETFTSRPSSRLPLAVSSLFFLSPISTSPLHIFIAATRTDGARLFWLTTANVA